ncbi:MAG TPA: hypothetical protein VFG63_12335 [Nocardioidaceae bacterium]|nr:hypothetical protein [Nocardioidaceae bacterium]
MNLDLARAVADAVLYEGYLLYPYRASSDKNRSRWQFGVLGPPGAAEAGVGEESSMSMQCLLTDLSETGAVIAAQGSDKSVVVHLRFLQLQRREVYDGQGRPVEQLTVDETTWMTWDEAVDQELTVVLRLADLAGGISTPVSVTGSEQTEPITGRDGTRLGHVLRRRWPLSARLSATTTAGQGCDLLTLRVDNLGTDPAGAGKERAIRSSFIGTHLLVEAHGVAFVSLLEPPDELAGAAAACAQHRCWPVLTGAPGDTDLVLGSPIILYDYPQIAGESAGALFDATEIDEILTLRVMTMTDEEKAEARATDPRAREIIDRCDEMTPETLQQMHGILRDPHAGEAPLFPEPGPFPELEPFPEPEPFPGPDPAWPTGSDVRNLEPPSFRTGDVPWWSPEADEAVQPGVDAVTVDGVRVARDSLVRVHPNRRADAQDLFFADQVARVTAVLSDVDGGTHVALLLLDDPAAEINDLAGRYWYFAPDEITPLSPDEARAAQATQHPAAEREESRP